jgi:hypothetical protein
MELAFRPSRQDDLTVIQKENREDYNFILGHYVHLREQLESFQEQYEEFCNKVNQLLENSYRKTFSLLPELDLATLQFPPIFFCIFANDGGSGESIVLDLLATIEFGEEAIIGFIAHELHHHYWDQILRLDINQIASEDMLFLYLIDRIAKEGVADVFDKDARIPAGGRPYLKARRQWFSEGVAKSPDAIQKINALIKEKGYEPTQREELSRAIRKLLIMNGNPLGYYMFQFIQRNCSKEEICQIAGDPFYFFKLYQQSAAAESAPRFCEEFVQLLKELENKYRLSEDQVPALDTMQYNGVGSND